MYSLRDAVSDNWGALGMIGVGIPKIGSGAWCSEVAGAEMFVTYVKPLPLLCLEVCLEDR